MLRGFGCASHARSLPFIVGSLHPKPKTRAVAELFSKTSSNFAVNRLSLKQNILQMLWRYTQVSCYLGFRLFRCRQNVFSQQCAGMCWTTIWISCHLITLSDNPQGLRRRRHHYQTRKSRAKFY